MFTGMMTVGRRRGRAWKRETEWVESSQPGDPPSGRPTRDAWNDRPCIGWAQDPPNPASALANLAD